jgi:CBS domain-containing protein
MSPDRLAKAIIREVPVLEADDGVSEAVAKVIEADVSALPIVDARGRLYGVFGEREFIGAMFPGYLRVLKSAAFIPESIGEAIEMRLECAADPVSKYANTEKIAAGPQHSDAQLAETFLHHRVRIIPIIDADQRVLGIVTRSDFFKTLGDRFKERESDSA